MLWVQNAFTDPYFNIAAEEYFLKHGNEDVFMVYINEPSIIIGKHQNVFAELNYWFVKENNIKVVRRLSGGGTVFHDPGNINFTFIQNGKEGDLVDFRRYVQPIVKALNEMGVPAEQNGRNDIVVQGLKVSGNAEHVFKNRTLHHGTLLFSSDLGRLREALRVNLNEYSGKAVQSVRSPVANIAHFMAEKLPVDSFKQRIESSVLRLFPDVAFYSFSESDIVEINQLVTDKYSTWAWNFGYSPKFTVNRNGLMADKPVSAECEVEKGMITKIVIRGDFTESKELEQILTGILYAEDEIFSCIMRHFPGHPYLLEIIRVLI